ncbi:ankyrin repeat domain-containing protein [Halobaculum sp. MBLA0147]|uniref:ankyrin repeat domain-containing protein n=1 Tax=Halobaculum sp. MBLA0147 TaxID=3079934 RepID=UPI003523D63A
MTDNRDDLYRSTEIESAIIQGNRSRYDELIDDADLDHRSGNGSTLLHKATTMGRTEIVADLLERGIDIDAVDDGGRTALHCAVEKDYEEIALRLLEYGARVDIDDVYGARALQKAVSNANYELAEALLEHGADPTHENEADISPLHIARRADADRYIELLESYVDGEDA